MFHADILDGGVSVARLCCLPGLYTSGVSEIQPVDERLIFLEGKHVRLKVPTRDDVLHGNWISWFNSQSLADFNQHHYFPVTVDQQLAFLAQANSPTRLQLGIVARDDADESPCGMISLSNISWINRNAEVAIIIDNRRTANNPNIFLESWSLMLRHGFEGLGLSKIYGGTFHPNITNVLTKKFGFHVEGIRRRHVFKNNTWHDVTDFAVFADTVMYPEYYEVTRRQEQ